MPSIKAIERFNQLLTESIHDDTFVSLTCTNPISKSVEAKIHARSITLKKEKAISCASVKDNQEFTSNYDIPSFIEVYSNFSSLYKQQLLKLTTGSYQLLKNKKGEGTMKQTSTKSIALDTSHDVSKNYLIPPSERFLIALGISSASGNVLPKSQKKYRQINKFIEILSKHIPNTDDKSLSIYDFGCGKAYLSFATYTYLNSLGIDVTMTGLDLKMKVIENCNALATKLHFSGLDFKVGDITDFSQQPMDVLIALHACDIATDIAIAKGIQSQAKLIVMAPCCHKQIRKSIAPTSFSKSLLKHGILEERMATIITDSIRSLILESHGYKTKVFEFISSEHTAKNIMILAEYNGVKKDNTGTIADIKSHYGIEEHYLESLV